MNEFINPGKLFIAVIGGGDIPPETAQIAEEVGREIARRGAMLVCGGLGGVMEAACRGAVSAGGLTIGILPGDGGGVYAGPDPGGWQAQ